MVAHEQLCLPRLIDLSLSYTTFSSHIKLYFIAFSAIFNKCTSHLMLLLSNGTFKTFFSYFAIKLLTALLQEDSC